MLHHLESKVFTLLFEIFLCRRFAYFPSFIYLINHLHQYGFVGICFIFGVVIKFYFLQSKWFQLCTWDRSSCSWLLYPLHPSLCSPHLNFPASQHYKILQAYLICWLTSCPSPKISSFSKNFWFLLLQNGFRHLYQGARCACGYWGVYDSGPLSN